MTGIRRENIRRAIDDAILSKLVIQRDDKKGAIYRINKKTEEYNLSSTRMTQKCHPTGCGMSSNGMTNVIQRNDNAPFIEKENIKEKRERKGKPKKSPR